MRMQSILQRPWMLCPKILLDPSLFFITADINVTSYGGHQFQINPASFIPGDSVFWRYAISLVKKVEILPVVPPTLLKPVYRHSIKTIEDSSCSGEPDYAYHFDPRIPVLKKRSFMI